MLIIYLQDIHGHPSGKKKDYGYNQVKNRAACKTSHTRGYTVSKHGFIGENCRKIIFSHHLSVTKASVNWFNSQPRSSSTKLVVRPAVFNGSTPWEDYKAQFDLVAGLNSWHQATKATYLAVSLCGPAQAVLGDLDENQRSNYKDLIDALENCFGTHNRMEMFRISLRNRRRKTGESLPELAQAIRRLTRQAFPDVTAELMETMVKGSFIDALGTADEHWKVHQTRPKTLNKALSAAVELETFFTADKERSGVARAVQSSSTHKLTDVNFRQELSELKALVKQMTDQKNNMSSNARDGRPWMKRPSGCWGCGQKGHIQHDCPEWKPREQAQEQGNENLSGIRAGSRQDNHK